MAKNDSGQPIIGTIKQISVTFNRYTYRIDWADEKDLTEFYHEEDIVAYKKYLQKAYKNEQAQSG